MATVKAGIKEGILCLLVLLFIALPHAAIADTRPPVGCEPYNSTVLHCWNNNTKYETDTYYMWTGKGLQMANNNTGRFGWVTYRQGFFVNDELYDMADLDLTKEWGTDEATYYYIRLYDRLTKGNKVADFEYRIQQYRDDYYVNFTTIFITREGFEGANINITPVRAMQDIDIGNNGMIDRLEAIQDGIVKIAYTNETRNASVDTYYFTVIDSASDNFIRWLWSDQRDREFRLNNGTLLWLRPSASLVNENNRRYSLSEYWIDAPLCPGCTPLPSCNINTIVGYTTGSVNTETNFIHSAGIVMSTEPGCSCTLCFEFQQDTKYVDYTATYPPAFDYSAAKLISGSADVTVTSTGTYSNTIRCGGRNGKLYLKVEGDDYGTVYENVTCNDVVGPSVNNTNPPHLYADKFGYQDFGCNVSDNTGLHTVELWTNLTGAWAMTQSSGRLPLLTYFKNQTFTQLMSPGVYNWTCKVNDTRPNNKTATPNRTITIAENYCDTDYLGIGRWNITADTECNATNYNNQSILSDIAVTGTYRFLWNKIWLNIDTTTYKIEGVAGSRFEGLV